jgi:hypothetical protein
MPRTSQQPAARVPASRLRLAGMLLATVAFGILTRRLHLGTMLWDKSAGDALYAIAAYFALAIVFPRAAMPMLALLALAFCFGIELFQLTGIALTLSRQWRGAHWFLGSTFAWHDLLCYAVGVPLAALVHRIAGRATPSN